MIFKTCPDCGASLDPGETCDCTKEKKLPATNETASIHTQTDNGKPASEYSIADNSELVKSFDLRDLRQEKNIQAKDIVELLRRDYPGFDKMLNSKVENGEKYGITLRWQAIDIVLRKYAPEKLTREKRRRNGYHKLTASLSCRVDNDTYSRFKAAMKKAGYDTVQDALTELVLKFIETEENNEKRNH